MKARTAALVAISGLTASMAQGQLLNPSFEIPGFPGVFEDWNQYGSNISADTTEIVLDGAASMKIFGQFIPNFNASGVFQNIGGAAAGDMWEAKINVAHITGDTLQGGNRAFFSLVWVGADGVNIAESGADILFPSDAPDTWVEHTIQAVAPYGTAEAQINIGFLQDDQFSGGAAHYDVASLERLSTGNPFGFINGGFEDNVFGRVFSGWTEFGNSIPNILKLGSADGVSPLAGDSLAFMFGQFNGDPAGNDTGVFQTLPASAGEEWTASVNVRHDSGDAIGVGNAATLSIVFTDGAGGVLGDNPVPAADSSTPTDTWIPVSVTATAPAGTQEVQIVLVYSQAPPTVDMNGDTVVGAGDEPTGAVMFDEALLEMGGGGRLCADQNGDGNVDPTDFTSWIANFNAGSPLADVNQNGTLEPADFSAWIAAFNQGAGGPICNP